MLPPMPIITTTNAAIKIFNFIFADNTITISSEKNIKPYTSNYATASLHMQHILTVFIHIFS